MTHAEVRKLFTTHKLSCPLSSLRANMTFCCAEVGLSTAKASGLQTQYIKHPLRVSPVILCTYRYFSNALQDVFVLTMNKSKARSRFSQNKCTICGEQCAKFNSFPCGNCVESTHSACVAMCEVNTRRFKEKNEFFIVHTVLRLRRMCSTTRRVWTGMLTPLNNLNWKNRRSGSQ